MFENFKAASGPAKIMVASVVGMLLGFGLCGLSGGSIIASRNSELFTLGGAMFIISLLGLMVSAFVWFVAGITRDDQ